MAQERHLTKDDIEEIETVISKGWRAEVAPVKDGVKVLRVIREEVKAKKT